MAFLSRNMLRGVLLLGWVFFVALPLYGQVIWNETSFADFADGVTDQNLYVSHRANLETTAGGVEYMARFDADLNGYVDFACVEEGGAGQLKVFFMGASGLLRTSSFAFGDIGGDIQFADLNVDGYPELLHGGYDSGELSIYWNRGGSYTASDVTRLPNHTSEGVYAADFDKDGYLDIVLSGIDGTALVYWGAADGYIASRVATIPIRPNGERSIECADFDNDGDMDIAMVTAVDYITLLENRGGRTFTVHEVRLVSANTPTGLSVADFDKNGYVDIVVTRQYTDNMEIYFNNGGWTFTRCIVSPGPSNGGSGVCDFNGDGWLDLVFLPGTCHISDPRLPLQVYLNTGAPPYFSDPPSYTIGGAHGFTALGGMVIDANSDGAADIFVDGFEYHSYLLYGPAYTRIDSFDVYLDHHGMFLEPGNIKDRTQMSWYESNVFDTGIPTGFTSGSVSWVAYDERDYAGGTFPRPMGSNVVLFARSGDTPLPGPFWTDWELLTDDAPLPVALAGHSYLQYRAELWYFNTAFLPWLEKIEFRLDEILTLEVSSDTVCDGDSATLVARPSIAGGTFFWNTGARTDTLRVWLPGTYTCTYTDPGGGTAEDAGTLTVNPRPTVAVNRETVCAGTAVTLATTVSVPGGTYLWSTGATTPSITVTPTATTNYPVTYTLPSGCNGAGTGLIVVNPLPTITLDDRAMCAGRTITLTPSASIPSGTWRWSTGETTPTLSVAPESTSTFEVTYTLPTGCEARHSCVVRVDPVPIVTVNSVTLCPGDTAILRATPSIPGGSYSWSTGAGDSIIRVTDGGSYTVSYVAPSGCLAAPASGVVTVSHCQHAELDSVRFSEETDCDDANRVSICYQLLNDTASIAVEMSSDDGTTWDVPLNTLESVMGSLGPGILPGEHCFLWVMDADLPGVEGERWVFRIHAGIAPNETTAVYHGILDSRPPDVRLDNPGELFAGESFELTWHIADAFPVESPPCSLAIVCADYETSLVTTGTGYRWTVPDSLSGECTVALVVPDSFCNRGSAAGMLTILPQPEPEDWTVDIRFTPDNPQIRHQTITLGMSVEGTEGFDPAIDRVYVPPPANQQDAFFTLEDPAYPAYDALARDIRALSVRQAVWTAYTHGQDGEISWQPSALPPGQFILDHLIDMRVDSTYPYEVNDTVVIEYNFPRMIHQQFSLHIGWNLLGISGFLSSPEVDSVFPGALSVYRYAPSRGYLSVSRVATGVGYWVMVDGDTSWVLPMGRTTSMYWQLPIGWNLIAGPIVFPSCLIDDMGFLPADMCSRAFEMRLRPGAYDPIDAITPGYGAWLLFSSPVRGHWVSP